MFLSTFVPTGLKRRKYYKSIELPSLTEHITFILIHNLFNCRIDYCSSLLFGLPHKSLHQLQLVQNSVARILTKTLTTPPPSSFRNSTGSRSNSEETSKPYCTHSRPSVTLPLQICQLFSKSPPHPAPSDPLPPFASLCPSHGSAPWGDQRSTIIAPQQWKPLPPGIRNVDSLYPNPKG